MRTLLQDLRFGARMLVKSPGVTAAAVISLALGIGANTMNFGVANAMLFRPLPVEQPERLVSVFTAYRGSDRNNHTSYPDYLDLRDRSEVFSGLAAHFHHPMSLKAGDKAEVIIGQTVSWNYFSVLGVKPVLGRTFLREEDLTPGSHPVAVLSYRVWGRLFASDPGIAGKTVLVNSYPFTVVGVAPEGFTGLCTFLSPDVWVPMMMSHQVSMFPVNFNERSWTMVRLVGRLKPGVSLAQAQAATDVLAANLAHEHPNSNETKHFPMVEANRNRVGWLNTTDTQERLTAILMVVVGLVLLIACFNVANLQLARAAARQKEIAVRLSLGASRGRIFRQLLTESVMLALLAGVAGTLIAVWAMDLFMAFLPSLLEFPIEIDLSLDRGVLGFTMLVALIAGVLFGLAPARQAIQPGQLEALKDQAPSVTPGRSRSFVQNSLVVAQVALSLVLLIGTGLLVRSLNNTLAVDPGVDPRNSLVFPINLGFGQYDEAKGRQFYERLIQRLEAIPGVRSAALAIDVPLGQLHIRNGIEVDGYQAGEDEQMVARFNAVGPGYFVTLGIPILKGRGIEESDREGTRLVAVINEAMARRYWPGKEPLGRTIRSWGRRWEVVGVMKDGKYDSLNEAPQPYFCLPLRQTEYMKRLSVHVKTEGDPRGTTGGVLRAIQELDPNLPVSHIMTMTEFLNNAVDETSGPVKIVGIFGFLALVLAMVGVYGVISYSVSQRTHEFGIRTALGASRRQLIRLVLRKGLKMTLIGVAFGLAGALVVTRVLSGFLYGVNTLDPLVFTAVSVLLTAVAMLACYLPARWAARADPAAVLRHQ